MADEIDTVDKAPTNNTVNTNNSYYYDPRYGPLARVDTAGTQLPAFASELQPGLHKPGPVEKQKIGNPAPLGLAAFALTTFCLGCINMGARDITEPNIVVGVAYGYGGLVQLCAGMWYVLYTKNMYSMDDANWYREMAAGNTFGATALSSYGGFWISLAIAFTPGGFKIMSTLEEKGGGTPDMFYDSLGLFLLGWFIFTFLLVLCTLKSTFVFAGIFITVDIAFLLLGIGYIHRNGSSMPNQPVIKAGGLFALLAAFLSWYVCLAGLADNSNSFFLIPVFHFPWSEKGKASRKSNEA